MVIKQVTLGQGPAQGFHAVLTGDTDFVTNQTVLFDSIVFQTEDYYNPSAGEYNCPTPGIYYFAFSLKSASLSTIGGKFCNVTL